MDSDKIVPAIILAVILTVISYFLKPILPELPIIGAFFKGAAQEVGGKLVRDIIPSKDPCANAALHWKSAEEIGTRDVLEDHLNQFASCGFASIAKAKIAAMDKPKTAPADEVFWLSIKDSAEIARFEEFIRRFPTSVRLPKARQRVAELQAKLDQDNRVEQEKRERQAAIERARREQAERDRQAALERDRRQQAERDRQAAFEQDRQAAMERDRREKEAFRNQIRADSFKLTARVYANSWKMSFSIENLSGTAVGIGILFTGTTVGACSGAMQISGLPAVFPEGVGGVGGLVMRQVSQNPNLLTLLPIGGRISATAAWVDTAGCTASDFSRMDSIPVTVTAVLAVPGKDKLILPLSTNVSGRMH